MERALRAQPRCVPRCSVCVPAGTLSHVNPCSPPSQAVLAAPQPCNVLRFPRRSVAAVPMPRLFGFMPDDGKLFSPFDPLFRPLGPAQLGSLWAPPSPLLDDDEEEEEWGEEGGGEEDGEGEEDEDEEYDGGGDRALRKGKRRAAQSGRQGPKRARVPPPPDTPGGRVVLGFHALLARGAAGVSAFDANMLPLLAAVKAAAPNDAIAAARLLVETALVHLAGVSVSERPAFLYEATPKMPFLDNALLSKFAGTGERIVVLFGHKENKGERVNAEDGKVGSTGVTVRALRAGMASCGGSLATVDIGFEDEDEEYGEEGDGRHATVKVAAAEKEATLAVLGVLFAAAAARGSRVVAMRHMLGRKASVLLKLPLMRKEALEALDSCVDSAPNASGAIAVGGGPHLSNAGRVAGAGKAAAPLLLLHLAAQALYVGDGEMRGGGVPVGATELFLRMAAVSLAALAAMPPRHAPWVALTLSETAAKLIACFTHDGDAEACAHIEQAAISHALAAAPDATALAALLDEAAVSCAMPVPPGGLPDGVLGGFVEKRFAVDSFAKLLAAADAAAASGGLHAPPRPLPDQCKPLQQLAAVLAEIERKGEVFRRHEWGTVYLKYAKESGVIIDELGVYGGSEGQKALNPQAAADARQAQRNNSIRKAPSGKDDAWTARVRRLREECDKGSRDPKDIELISLEFSVRVLPDTFPALGDANGLKGWLEATLIDKLWPYNSCDNHRMVALSLRGTFTSAEAADLGE